MNYDGKAFVVNISTRLFASVNGQATIIEEYSNPKQLCSIIENNNILNVSHLTNSKNMKVTSPLYSCGLVPYSISVLGAEKQQSFKPTRYTNVRSAYVHDKQEDFYYDITKRVIVSRTQPTNIKYNPKSAIVYDSASRESDFQFSGVSANVYSKTEVVIHEQSSNNSDMSLVVQKNSFIEIKIPEDVIDVVNLPDTLMFLPGCIKGTFTKSGEYNIKIKYPNGEQILNIIVPYYQRLL